MPAHQASTTNPGLIHCRSGSCPRPTPKVQTKDILAWCAVEAAHARDPYPKVRTKDIPAWCAAGAGHARDRHPKSEPKTSRPGALQERATPAIDTQGPNQRRSGLVRCRSSPCPRSTPKAQIKYILAWCDAGAGHARNPRSISRQKNPGRGRESQGD